MGGAPDTDNGESTYWIERWGSPYFSINDKGHVAVKPSARGPEGDLFELVEALVQRGIEAPILIRCDGIVRDRIAYLQEAFKKAIAEYEYQNTYHLAFPIKVNPQCRVVELIERAGQKHPIGLEVGSKPELLAVMTFSENLQALLLCNGYKDAEYMELALIARKLGRRAIIIVEQPYELPLVLDIARRLDVEAEIGFRMKLSNRGAGRWHASSGDLAKFGLNIHEIMHGVEQLQQAGKIGCLKLLHFHIGSQITSISAVKRALLEASRMYTELAALCPNLSFFDAGGGLGVDYEGTNTSSDSSMNYSVEEYARSVVSAIGEACQKAKLPPPTLITESGRALAAHHAILITEVIDVTSTIEPGQGLAPPNSSHHLLLSIFELYRDLTSESALESLHNAHGLRESILENFMQGNMNLFERAYAEDAYRRVLIKIRQLAEQLSHIPPEIEKIDEMLVATYFCNFSLFQSLPDSWAIEQVFPVMPIHRLHEEATQKGILADMSCDSDGKIAHFLGRREYSPTLPLHSFHHAPYYLGIFLVGAYQEILGGLHNLFGDANAVHVELDEEGQWVIKHVVEGDTIEEVLTYAQYNPRQLMDQQRLLIEKALKSGRLW